MTIDLSSQADSTFKPKLFDVHKVLDEDIVGEFESRLSLFTNWVLSNQNVLMSGPRSSGKTWITDHVTPFLGNSTFIMGSGSAKSSWYQMEEIKKASHVIVLELNKCPADFLETLKDWGEGKDSTYKSTVVEGGNRTVKSFKLTKKPFVFCLADEDVTKVGEQLMSRLTRIRTDNSVSQNTAVLAQQAKLARMRKNERVVNSELKTKLYYHVQTLPLMSSIEFRHPSADIFVDVIPKLFTDCRRDFPKYLANTYGITRFHWKERLSVQTEDKPIYLVTPQDMYLNHEIYGQTLIESALKCSGMEREMIKIVEIQDTTTRTIVQQQLKKMGLNVSAHMVTKHLNQLADLGYIGKEKVGTSINYSKNEQEEFRFSIDWQKVIEQSKKGVAEAFPEVSEQYRIQYCTSPAVLHPFTGKTIQLEEQKSAPKVRDRSKLETYLPHQEEEIVK